MNVYERQARALETIAHALKGIGKTLERIEEIFSPEIQLIDESLLKGFAVGENDQEVDDGGGGKESPGTCFMTEEPFDKCETWNGDGCEYLVRPGEPWPGVSRAEIERAGAAGFAAGITSGFPDAISIAAAKKVADILQRRNERTEGGDNG